MTDKELRRLKRAELLEILYYLQKENEELKAELQKLKEQPANSISEDFRALIGQIIRETLAETPAEVPADTAERSDAGL